MKQKLSKFWVLAVKNVRVSLPETKPIRKVKINGGYSGDAKVTNQKIL